MFLRHRLTIGLVVALAASGPAQAETRTLAEALAAAYSNNPALQAARAQLRAVDENVPAALAGWRPQVTMSANAGYNDYAVTVHGLQTNPSTGIQSAGSTNANPLLGTNTEQLNVTQPIWRGGQTRAATNRAENQVMGQRARLMATEEQLFTNVINAFVNVIANQQVLALDVNNEQVLARQLQATNDRFRVGEITRTDVAQAEAALAGATAHPPDRRRQPADRPRAVPAVCRRTAGRAGRAATAAAARADAGRGARDGGGQQPERHRRRCSTTPRPRTISTCQYSKLMPNISLQGQRSATRTCPTWATTPRPGRSSPLSVPLYQGGAEYAAIRQARQQQQQTRKLIDDARRTAVQQVIAAWET